jgi:hypothetical protein
VTDPRGCCFVSYRRLRAAEVAALGRRLKVRGIPVWVDISDLGPGSTEQQIRDALEDEGCSSALVWVTPEVVDSPVIRRVEVPGIIARIKRKDGFFGFFVAAGGLDYDHAARVAAENFGTTDLRFWNQHKVVGDPATAPELDTVADLVLAERLTNVGRALQSGEAIRIGIWVRRQAPVGATTDLQLDWSDSFTGRHANVGAWEAELLPALASVHRQVGRRGGGHSVVLHGHPSLAVAVALGRAFPAVAGIPISWEQVADDGSRAEWSLAVASESSGYTINSAGIDPAGEGLAVLVSVMHDATLAFGATPGLPGMRASVEITPAQGQSQRLTAGGARQLATDIANAVRKARTDYLGVKDIHLFLATPVGLAIMLGQLLNSIGPIVVYEHVDEDAIGFYRPEVRLQGSSI